MDFGTSDVALFNRLMIYDKRLSVIHVYCFLQHSKGHYSKNVYSRFIVLALSSRLMFVKISMKFHEDILNGLVLSQKFVATLENTFALLKE